MCINPSSCSIIRYTSIVYTRNFFIIWYLNLTSGLACDRARAATRRTVRACILLCLLPAPTTASRELTWLSDTHTTLRTHTQPYGRPWTTLLLMNGFLSLYGALAAAGRLYQSYAARFRSLTCKHSLLSLIFTYLPSPFYLLSLPYTSLNKILICTYGTHKFVL